VDALQNIAGRKTIFRWLFLAIVSTGIVILREYDDIGFTYRIEEVYTFATSFKYLEYSPRLSRYVAKPAAVLPFEVKTNNCFY